MTGVLQVIPMNVKKYFLIIMQLIYECDEEFYDDYAVELMAGCLKMGGVKS